MTPYANLTDLHTYGLSAVACGNVTVADQQVILDGRNAWADGKLRGRYPLPLLAWDVDLRMNVAQLAAYDVMIRRGYNPAAGADINIRLRYEDASKWFDGVERGNVHPNITASPVTAPNYNAPQVTTSTKRGW